MTYKEAINNLKSEYDAFYIENKYSDGTHKEEFELLSTLKGEKVENALGWIKNCYDCFYKDELKDGNAFDYLESLIERKEE